MSERYSRIYTLPENLYADNSPILLEAGALLKNNQTNKVLAQLKLKNLKQKKLTACKVAIKAFDPSGAELSGIDDFSYLDISVSCGEDFGANQPIYLPDNATRSFSVAVIQAVFEDGEVWQHPVCEWKPVFQNRQKIEDRFSDVELQKQYAIEVGQPCKYVPMIEGNLFLCTCGNISLAEDQECSACKKRIETLLSALNLSELEEKRDARLAQEEAERLEKERIAEEKRLAYEAKKKKTIRVLMKTGAIVMIAIVAAVIVKQVIIPAKKYKDAEQLLVDGQIKEAAISFEKIADYKDAHARSLELWNEVAYREAEQLLGDGQIKEAAISFGKKADYKDARFRSLELWNEVANFNSLSAGSQYTVGLKTDETVIATGYCHGRCNVSGWKDIVAISAGSSHVVALKGGTVISTGDNKYGQCDVSSWTDIVAISASAQHTVGLKLDGTAIATGNSRYGQCGVSGWTDIVAISAGSSHTVGLKLDGTAIATGNNRYNQCDVSDWTDIVAISAGGWYTVGLRADGTVIAAGPNLYGECDVSGWKDIVAISAGGQHTVGLRANGTVIATGDNYCGQCNVSGWTDIVAISAGGQHTVGLRADGTAIATGNNYCGQCNVSGWENIKIKN